MDRRDWIVVGLIAASAIVLATPAAGQLLTRSGLPTPYGATSVAAADFNRDGAIDLAVGLLGFDGVEVFLGRGDGTFEPPVLYAPGLSPSALAAADLNHDGIPDIVIANGTGDSVIVLLGNGDGTFQAPVTYATPSVPVSIILSDFNNDGNLDVATAEQNDPCNCVAVLLGNGDGTFQEPAIITYAPLGADPLALAGGYFNGGGNLDLALTENFISSGAVQILLGNGDGTFTLGDSYALDPNPLAIVAADLRNNGETDLAVAALESAGLAVLLGNGDGTFQQPVYYDFGKDTNSTNVAIGDMNGDGIPDLVAAPTVNPDNFNYSAVYIFPGKGDGTFGSPEISYPVAYGSFPTGLTLADFNGDHKLDVAIADQTSIRQHALLNTGQVKFSPVSMLSFSNQKKGTTSSPQIVTLTNQGPSRLNISSMTTTGNFEATSTCGKSVIAKATCTISVTFRPNISGELYGTVQIIDSASTKPQVIALSGKAY